MADNSSWWQNAGDSLGVPSAIASIPLMKSLAARLGTYGAGAAGGLVAAPATAAGAFLYGMGDGKGNATTATGNEMDLYVRDPNTGQMIPNPALHGQNPMQPGVNTLPQAPQGAVAAPAVPGAAASPSPSPLPPGLAGGPNSGMLSAPLLQGSTGGFAPLPTAQPQAPQGSTGQPLSLAPPSPTPAPDFYNGPGSLNFGQGGADGYAPQGGGLISRFMQGVNGNQPNANASAQYGGPHAGLISRIMQTLGNTFHTNGGMTNGWQAPSGADDTSN